MQPWRASVLVIVLFALFFENAVPTLTQQKNPPEDIGAARMVLKVTTHLVMVDAVVKDRSGVVVSDLNEADFRIYENGKLQKVAVFGFRHGSNPSSLSKGELPPNTFTNVARLEEVGAPPTVLLIDTLNTPSQDVRYLREQLIKYVQNRDSFGNIAVYVLGNRIYQLQDFTANPESLRTGDPIRGATVLSYE